MASIASICSTSSSPLHGDAHGEPLSASKSDENKSYGDSEGDEILIEIANNDDKNSSGKSYT